MKVMQQAAYDAAMKALLSLPWQVRSEVCSALRFNDIFCWDCGYGDADHPNKNCPCANDE